MKILFAVDQWPFPPRNGITLPVANIARRLARDHALDCLLFQDDALPSSSQVDTDCFDRVFTARFARQGVASKMLQEALLIRPSFAAVTYRDLPSIAAQYDVIWASPVSALAMAVASRRRMGLSAPVLVGGISDVYTSVISKAAPSGRSGVAGLVSGLKHRLRGFTMSRHEASLLRECDLICVQTEADLRWIGRLGGHALQERTLICPNGVDSSLFSLPPSRTAESEFVLVADFETEYGKRAAWLLREVWVKAKAAHPQLRLTLVGRNASAELRQLIAEVGATYRDFVPDLRDVYAGYSCLLAPIFKGYGLINKVVEAMAAGCVVIGDETAFNGIPGFRAGVHGLVADDPEQFVQRIGSLLDEPAVAQGLRREARGLIESHFRWERRVTDIESRLARLKSGQDARLQPGEI